MPEQQVPQQQMSGEQIKALQEKIKQMSPEELKEFQKKQCIFCQIVSGKVQSKKVYEDDDVIAVLDVNPANPGHILIMPKEHYSIMPQIPYEDIEHIFMVTKALSNASLRALGVQGSNIIVANGVAAGQRAQHFMVHLIPRKENDNIQFQVPQKTIPEQELQKVRKALSESLGAKAEESEEKMTAVPLIRKQKVVEAEFKEKKEPRKRAKKKEVKKETKTKGKQKKANEGINLDDIAKVLGPG
ncbi:MAG: HIT domain-containing protein [Flavobacteriales bacterium]|jgi:histidine triad (HIT) family protein|nr:HIT domain-containing protein [Flavobacteriales bacterium]|tara:strand:- start:228 stop:956 length:729 start_codon:yes stop_codon:yes gene_type:complete